MLGEYGVGWWIGLGKGAGMDWITHAEIINRIQRKKLSLETQPEEDEFEAQRYTANWMCQQQSVTKRERTYLQDNFFTSRSF